MEFFRAGHPHLMISTTSRHRLMQVVSPIRAPAIAASGDLLRVGNRLPNSSPEAQPHPAQTPAPDRRVTPDNDRQLRQKLPQNRTSPLAKSPMKPRPSSLPAGHQYRPNAGYTDIRISGKVLYQLFHRDMISAPQGYRVQRLPQESWSKLGCHLTIGTQPFGGAGGQRVWPRQAGLLPFQRRLRSRMGREKQSTPLNGSGSTAEH